MIYVVRREVRTALIFVVLATKLVISNVNVIVVINQLYHIYFKDMTNKKKYTISLCSHLTFF